MPFNGQQRIRSLDRSMLARVARKNHPRIPFARQPDQFEHLASANLAGLVHHDDRALGQFTLEQKIGNRRWRRKSALSMSTTC